MESSSIHTMPSTLIDGMFVYVAFSLMSIMTTFMIYALARILDWSSNRPLPRVIQSSAFNILFASSVIAIAFLPLRGIDLIGLFARATEPIV